MGFSICVFGSSLEVLAQEEMPPTPYEAIAWLEEERNTVKTNEQGEVTEVIIDYVPDVFVVGDLEIFEKLEVLKINYTGQFHDRHMSGIARLTSLKNFSVDYCEEISEASLSVLRYLPSLEEVRLLNCEAVYSLKALGDCRSLRKIDISSNEHLDFHALKSLIQLPKLTSLILISNPTLEDQHLRWIGEMKGLTEIRLGDCEEITDDGLRYLGSLPLLSVLDISDNPNLTGASLDSMNGHSLIELNASNCGFTDATLANLAPFKALKKVNIDGNSAVLGAGLSVFSNFRQLEELGLSRFRVTNEILLALDGIESLKKIELKHCTLISGKGLKALSNSKSVEELNLSGCRRIDSDDLEEICKFIKLKKLDLTGTKIRPAGIKQLQKLKHLEELDLSECNWVDDKSIKTVSELPALKTLRLRQVPRLTDASLEHLAKLTTLESLQIEGNRNITGVGFAAFRETGKLNSLELKDLKNFSFNGFRSLARLGALEHLTLYADQISNRELEELKSISSLKEMVLSGDFDYDVYRQLIDALPNLDRENY